jgi:hypothetical protein
VTAERLSLRPLRHITASRAHQLACATLVTAVCRELFPIFTTGIVVTRAGRSMLFRSDARTRRFEMVCRMQQRQK